jgi:hypothetical protein
VDTDEEPENGDEEEEPPLSAWGAASEITRGLIALLLTAVGVLALYVAGGVFLGVLAWAAPVLAVLAAIVLLARYLSRRE